ncbi:hypothetical protein [Bacillus sp. FJAT-22090]|nr:hypothetical protein [Bacillus sp. FJAT-22090]
MSEKLYNLIKAVCLIVIAFASVIISMQLTHIGYLLKAIGH